MRDREPRRCGKAECDTSAKFCCSPPVPWAHDPRNPAAREARPGGLMGHDFSPPFRISERESVSLQVVLDALADVLVDYDVPTTRIIAEVRQTVAEYVEVA